MENLNLSLPESSPQESPQPQMKRSLVLSALFIVAILGAIGFFYGRSKELPVVVPPTEQIGKQEIIPTNTTTINTKPILSVITKEEYERYSNVAKKPTPYVQHKECAGLTNSFEGAQCEESIAVKENPGVLRIDKNCLSFKIQNGIDKKLCNINGEGSGEVALYSFSSHIPNIGYDIEVQYWEGGAGLLVNDKTGEEMQILSTPIPSPTGNKFLSYSIDMEANYNPNGFQVWEKHGDSFVKIVEYYTDDWTTNNTHEYGNFGIDEPVWINENAFVFQKVTQSYNSQTYVTTDIVEYAKFSF